MQHRHLSGEMRLDHQLQLVMIKHSPKPIGLYFEIDECQLQKANTNAEASASCHACRGPSSSVKFFVQGSDFKFRTSAVIYDGDKGLRSSYRTAWNPDKEVESKTVAFNRPRVAKELSVQKTHTVHQCEFMKLGVVAKTILGPGLRMIRMSCD